VWKASGLKKIKGNRTERLPLYNAVKVIVWVLVLVFSLQNHWRF
jgi:hypothetical protein